MPTPLDAYEEAVQQASTPNQRLQALNALAWAAFEDDRPRATELAQQAHTLAQELGDQTGLAESLRTLARAGLFTGQFDQALAQALDARRLAEELELPHLQLSVLNTMASCYRALGDLRQSLDLYIAQRELAETTGSAYDQARALVGIGTLSADLEDYSNALAYSEQARVIFEKIGNTYWMGIILNNIAFMQFKLGRYQQAIETGLSCLEFCRRAGNRRGEIVSSNSIAEFLLEQGSYASAQEYIEIAFELEAQANMPDLQTESHLLRGQVYARQGDLDQAAVEMQQALKIAESIKHKHSMYDSHIRLAEVYKKLGDYQRALAHYEQYHLLKEAIASEQAAEKLRNLEVLHRTQAAQQEAAYYARLNEELEGEVRKRTDELQRANAQLERLNRTKTDFISVTAHELRTPLTVLKGYSQMLHTDAELKKNAAYRDLLGGIVKGTNRLSEIVNAMLMMAKIDSQALEIFTEPLSIYGLLTELVLIFEPLVHERRQVLQLDEQGQDLPAIEGDRDVLKTVFSNLIENAIKYTPDRGRIQMSIRHWQVPPRSDLPANAIQIQVSDTGIGIASENLKLIFSKYYQTGEKLLHSSGKNKFKGGGPGLGLAIARGIIEAHHGQLWAESPGYDENSCPGSSFYVVLPVSQPR